MKNSIFLAGSILTFLVGALLPNAYASEGISEEEKESGFYNENGFPKYTHDRPAINPDFAPDEDCNIAYELKCVPGTDQKCPEGYNGGDDNVCSPKECQEGYHEEEDDETGLCYPDDEGCSQDDYVLVEREDGKGMICAYFYSICDEAEHSSKEYCIEWCEEDPDRLTCKDFRDEGTES